MSTRSITPEMLSKLTGLTSKRIKKILENGESTLLEREKIDKQMYRVSLFDCNVSTVDSIKEQIEIVDLLQHSLLSKFKNKIGVEMFTTLETYLEDIVIETAYYGVLLSRSGQDNRIMERVRERRRK